MTEHVVVIAGSLGGIREQDGGWGPMRRRDVLETLHKGGSG